MDPLSDVLSLLKVRVHAARGFQAGDHWSVTFEPSSGIKLLAVVTGGGWLVIDEVEEAIRVGAGDCLLLPSGRGYRVASDLSLPSLSGKRLVSSLLPNEIAQLGPGSGCFGLAGHFDLAGENAEVLLSMLPPIVHVRENSDKQVLRWCLERMRKELEDPQPGASLAAQQLATLMLVQILRTYLTTQSEGNPGWMFALTDKKIGVALQAMHEIPSHPWTLGSLAQRASMSRTGFAVRFKELVGLAPLNYLTRWRMSLAKERILNSPDLIATIAMHVGYQSESAFSTAFRRLVGCAPRGYAAFLKREANPEGLDYEVLRSGKQSMTP